MNSIFRLPLTNRYTELADYIDQSAVKELEILFPKLVAEIFSTNLQSSWGLRTLKSDVNYNSFNAVYNFLLPNGPMFRLCYKLLLDCHLRYEFPYHYLPDVIQRRLEDTSDISFYKHKLLTQSKTSTRNYIYLNAFEYYMFHFAYHLINPALQLPDENLLEWDTVYLRLVEAYLEHFVPCTTSLVFPLLNQSPSSMSPSQPAVNSYSPTSKSPVSIFRDDVLKKMSPSPPSFARTKTSSSAEIWRSELVATLFIDFWLSCQNNESVKSSIAYAGQKLWSVECLPSREQLRCIRVLLRHLHYFSNHILPDDCAMNDLKREIISNNRRTIYLFFWRAMTQLPLDSSYKLLLESWFTYIQPWRYTNPYAKNIRLKDSHEEGIERRWFSFIAENLIMYTRLYFVVLTRLSHCDLTTYKISSMSYRLMQVFSQPQLLDYIIEVENYLEEGRLGSINSWNSLIRQNIYSLEKIDYRYDFFYSQNHSQQVLEFSRQIEESLPSLRLRKIRLQEDDNISFMKWLKEQLSGSIRYSSMDEIEKIEYYLTQTLCKLYHVHKIPVNEAEMNSTFLNELENVNCSRQSVSSFDSMDGSNFSTSSLQGDPRERRKVALSFTYEGDPDLYPIRTWESKFLVRILYFICLWINMQFQREFKKIYYEDSIRGGICRQLLCPPQNTYYFEKRSSPDGYTRRISKVLPPRVSFRWCASYYSVFTFLFFYMLVKFFQCSFLKVTSVILFFYVVYLIANSVFFSPPISEIEEHSILR